MKASNTESAGAVIRILKVSDCPSQSGKSTLTYQIGSNAKSEIYFRVFKNSSSGFFSQEWVPLVAIQQLFATAPNEKEITSFILYPLFEGKSLNTPAFLFAGLKAEGLVVPSTTKRRCYECTDGKEFFAKVKALISSGVALSADDKPAKVKGKTSSIAKGKAQKAKDDWPIPAEDESPVAATPIKAKVEPKAKRIAASKGKAVKAANPQSTLGI
jgi:hypothetical protein